MLRYVPYFDIPILSFGDTIVVFPELETDESLGLASRYFHIPTATNLVLIVDSRCRVASEVDTDYNVFFNYLRGGA